MRLCGNVYNLRGFIRAMFASHKLTQGSFTVLPRNRTSHLNIRKVSGLSFVNSKSVLKHCYRINNCGFRAGFWRHGLIITVNTIKSK